jgi:hypothetical protein
MPVIGLEPIHLKITDFESAASTFPPYKLNAPRRNRTFNLLLIKQTLYHLAIGLKKKKKIII